MEKLNINQWAEEDRPREKMLLKGASALSDAELLAILIGSGNTDESAVGLMQRVLSDCHNDLSTLAKWDINRLTTYKGLGPAKCVSIQAALELGKRRSLSSPAVRPSILSSADVYKQFHPLLADLPHEELWVLLLNPASKVIDRLCISRGGLDHTTADVRIILREALLQRATRLILVHNHPSGNIRPSQNDDRLTRHLKDAAKTLDICLCDHVIVTDGSYYSYNDEGRL